MCGHSFLQKGRVPQLWAASRFAGARIGDVAVSLSAAPPTHGLFLVLLAAVKSTWLKTSEAKES